MYKGRAERKECRVAIARGLKAPRAQVTRDAWPLLSTLLGCAASQTSRGDPLLNLANDVHALLWHNGHRTPVKGAMPEQISPLSGPHDVDRHCHWRKRHQLLRPAVPRAMSPPLLRLPHGRSLFYLSVPSTGELIERASVAGRSVVIHASACGIPNLPQTDSSMDRASLTLLQTSPSRQDAPQPDGTLRAGLQGARQ